MADEIRQTRQVNSDGSASVRTTEVDDKSNDAADARSVASRIVWFIAGLISILLVFRFAFILLGANTANSFANFIYSASHPFASPFFGLFDYKQVYGESNFEVSTLVAIIVYLLIAYGIAKLLTITQPRQD